MEHGLQGLGHDDLRPACEGCEKRQVMAALADDQTRALKRLTHRRGPFMNHGAAADEKAHRGGRTPPPKPRLHRQGFSQQAQSFDRFGRLPAADIQTGEDAPMDAKRFKRPAWCVQREIGFLADRGVRVQKRDRLKEPRLPLQDLRQTSEGPLSPLRQKRIDGFKDLKLGADACRVGAQCWEKGHVRRRQGEARADKGCRQTPAGGENGCRGVARDQERRLHEGEQAIPG